MRSPITTHILDTALGRPAAGVLVRLDRLDPEAAVWSTLAEGSTDSDGRVSDLLSPGSLSPGTYRMFFDTGAYWVASGSEGFYPYVEIVFSVVATDTHYHVPLLLNPYGYSTYRGS